jgi:AmiR/NasT family two-component response regulator
MPDIEPQLQPQHLRVLIANEKRDGLELLAQVVTGLGHEVIARKIDVKEVGPVTAREHPDVALVGLGLSSERALELITEIVREASCPVIAILHADDPAYIHEAAERGVFAYTVDGTPEELQGAIDITLQRFREHQSLQRVSARRDCGDCPLPEKLAFANDLIVELQHQLRELRHEVENERAAAAWAGAAL